MNLLVEIAGVAWLASPPLLALVAAWRQPRPDTRLYSGDVVVFRPCAGHEPGLRERLLSIRTVGGLRRVTVVFGVGDPQDPALPAMEAAAETLRAEGYTVVTGVFPPRGPNRKASQLVGVVGWMARRAGESQASTMLVNVDSDVDLTGFDLEGLLAPLADARIGATWSPTVERRSITWGDRASAAVLSGSLQAFPLLCGLDPAALVGKVFAIRPEAATWEGLETQLGEDVALARSVTQHGYHVLPVAAVAVATPQGRRFGDVVGRYRRWLAVLRAQRPLHLAAYPLWLSPVVSQLLLAAALGEPRWGAAALVSRWFVALVARWRADRAVRPVVAGVDAVLAEMVLGLAWFAAIASRRVVWRGVGLRIGGDGRLEGGA